MLLLLAIRIRHCVYRDVSMWVKRDTNAVRCCGAILPWTLVVRVGTAYACRPGRSGRDASGSRDMLTDGWATATGTTICADASVSFSASRAFQMAAMAMRRSNCQLRRVVEARTATVGPATALAWEALAVRVDDSIHNRRGCL